MSPITAAVVISAILIPAAAVHQGLVSQQNLDAADLASYCDAALTKVLAYCEQADHLLRAELR